MADNSNYIGVAMGLDVTDLKSGLNEASKQISKANADFKAASSGMDDWTKSTEGLQAKVKQLDAVLGMQKSKLAGLKAEYEKVVSEQGANSDAAQKLYIRMKNQEAVVNKTKKEFDNFKSALNQAEAGTLDLEKATIKANGEIKELGDGAASAGDKVKGGFGGTVAKGIAGGIAAIGAAAVAAVGSFLSLAESTRETRENMNKLTTGFTTAGFAAADATNTYNELYSVLGDEGQATEAAAHLAQLANSQEDLSKWTTIATGVYATFGDSLPIEGLTEAANETAKTGQLTGSLADALNWAGVSEEAFQAKLDAASSEQERQAIITSTLNGLYSEQAGTFKELNGDIMAARDADAALSQAMAELGAIAEPIMTALKVLAVDLLNSITPFVELIGGGLKGALEGTAGATDMLAEGLGGILNVLVTRITEMLPTILDVILQLIPSIADTLLDALPQLLDVVIELVTQILNLLSEVAPQLIAKIVALIPVLVESLIAAVPQLLQAAITLLMAIVQALPTIITNLISALPSLINTIINALLIAIPMLVQAAIQLFMAIVQALPTIIQELVRALPSIINAIIDGLLNAMPLLLQAAIDLLMAIIEAIPTILSLLVKEIPSIVRTISKTLISRLPDLIKGGVQLWMGLIKAIPQIIAELVKNIPTIIKTIVSGLADGISDVASVGKDIIRGLWDGIKDMSSWISKKIKGFGESVLGGIKSFFGIKSPSKVMEKEVGVQLAAGVANGIEKGGDAAVSAIHDLGQDIMDEAEEVARKAEIDVLKAELAALKTAQDEFRKVTGKNSYDIGLEIMGKEAELSAALKKYNDEVLASAKLKLQNLKVYNDLSAKEEMEYWDTVRQLFDEGTQGRIDADALYFAAQQKHNEELLKAAEENAEKIAKIQEEVANISERRAKLETEYAEDVAAAWEKCNKDIAAAEKKYEDAVDSRAGKIASSLGLFDVAEIERGQSKDDMTDALKSQVTALTDWKKSLGDLEARGVDEALIDELQNMGVNATGYLEALNSMTDEELTEYVNLWRDKNALARERAVTELEPLKAETEATIAEIKANTQKELGELHFAYLTEMLTLTEEYTQLIKVATAEGVKIGGTQVSNYKLLGAQLMDGITLGVISKESGLVKAVSEAIFKALAAAQAIAGIHSPSKLFREKIGVFLGEGIGVGILDSMPTVKKNLSAFTDYIQSNLGNIKNGLSLDGIGGGGGYSSNGGASGGNHTVVNAGMTVNYNGTLSRKKLKRLENDQYRAIKTKLIAEGAI